MLTIIPAQIKAELLRQVHSEAPASQRGDNIVRRRPAEAADFIAFKKRSARHLLSLSNERLPALLFGQLSALAFQRKALQRGDIVRVLERDSKFLKNVTGTILG